MDTSPSYFTYDYVVARIRRRWPALFGLARSLSEGLKATSGKGFEGSASPRGLLFRAPRTVVERLIGAEPYMKVENAIDNVRAALEYLAAEEGLVTVFKMPTMAADVPPDRFREVRAEAGSVPRGHLRNMRRARNPLLRAPGGGHGRGFRGAARRGRPAFDAGDARLGRVSYRRDDPGADGRETARLIWPCRRGSLVPGGAPVVPQMPSCTLFAMAGQARTVMLLGSSGMTWTDTGPSGTLPKLLEAELSRRVPGVVWLCDGVEIPPARNMAARVRAEVESHRPAVVVLGPSGSYYTYDSVIARVRRRWPRLFGLSKSLGEGLKAASGSGIQGSSSPRGLLFRAPQALAARVIGAEPYMKVEHAIANAREALEYAAAQEGLVRSSSCQPPRTKCRPIGPRSIKRVSTSSRRR